MIAELGGGDSTAPNGPDGSPPRVVQIALVSADLPATVRRYTEVFGFADAGGRVFWGPWLARIQGLGDDVSTTLWWMVGRQDLVQLEVFAYADPVSRPLPGDWLPGDIGWAGWAMTVPDFDEALSRLRATGVATLSAPATHAGVRRVAFRDPDIGIVVEVLEEGRATPGGIRPHHYDLAPAVVSVTLNVSDLERSRTFLVDTCGLVPTDIELHPAGAEQLFDQSGVERQSFVVCGEGDVFIEVVSYRQPTSRPRPQDHRLSDLGMMNIGIGYRRRSDTDRLVRRLAEHGITAPAELPETPAGGVYISDAENNSWEVISQPREFDGDFGFAPQPALMRPPAWPQSTQRG